jgi:hypothetical protein
MTTKDTAPKLLNHNAGGFETGPDGARMTTPAPTIHNPTHFEPRDYEVLDYLDNNRPRYFGQGIDAFEAEQAAWHDDMVRTFGADYARKIHHCVHCGNGSVRWITAVRHLPTNEVVTFGAVCTARLGFADKHAFKLAQLQARAKARKVRFTIYTKRAAFLVANPAIADALTHIDEPQHARNLFAKDVLTKLDQYGSLSVAQVAAVISSMTRDSGIAAPRAMEAAEPKGDAPSGRVTVTGTVLSIKTVDGYMPGTTAHKMLLKLANASRVWLTCTDSSITRGDIVTVTATFEVSPTDKSFAFGKRPANVTFARASSI